MIDKSALRRAMIERRAGLDPALGWQLASNLEATGLIRSGSVLAGYWPMGDEIDIRPVLYAAAERGVTLALPVTPPRGQALAFRQWRPGDALRPGRFGTSEPEGALAIPDLLLVPLLAFDRAGRRLGYGGGYYDRTLAACQGAVAIGCAFAAQEVDTVPTEKRDRRLNAIATEAGVVVVE